MKIKALWFCTIMAVLLASCAKDAEISETVTSETAIEIRYEDGTDIIEAQTDWMPQSTNELEKRNDYRSYYSFNTLTRALQCTGLDRAVFDGRKTVYAPSDAAFRTLGYDERSVCNIDKNTLISILLYHVVDGKVEKDGCIEMIDGNIAQLKEGSHGPEINGALNYTSFTLSGPGYNVRLNAINEILSAPTQNIVGTAAGTEMFSSLVAAVLAADPAVAAALSNPDASFTVFAPTNEAFSNLIDALGVGDLNGLVAAIGTEALTEVLLYHVVDACVFSNELSNGMRITTLLGEDITTEFRRKRKPRLVDSTGGKSKLELNALDIRTTNGVVHTIDRVLIPSTI